MAEQEQAPAQTDIIPDPAAAEAAAKPKKKYTAGSYALSFFIKTAVAALILWILSSSS